eukprot:12918823-Prorocentrum_lima.AAC.1
MAITSEEIMNMSAVHQEHLVTSLTTSLTQTVEQRVTLKLEDLQRQIRELAQRVLAFEMKT